LIEFLIFFYKMVAKHMFFSWGTVILVVFFLVQLIYFYPTPNSHPQHDSEAQERPHQPWPSNSYPPSAQE